MDSTTSSKAMLPFATSIAWEAKSCRPSSSADRQAHLIVSEHCWWGRLLQSMLLCSKAALEVMRAEPLAAFNMMLVTRPCSAAWESKSNVLNRNPPAATHVPAAQPHRDDLSHLPALAQHVPALLKLQAALAV
jgi:hypothetical protein